MNERKILLFSISLVCYFMYSVHMWFKGTGEPNATEISQPPKEIHPEIIAVDKTQQIKENVKAIMKTKEIPIYLKDTCGLLETFTNKPPQVKKKMRKFDETDSSSNTIAVIGMIVFLVVLTANAVMDVLKVREQEKLKRKLNPDGVRRQSLAEFANKKTLRRESSKISQQLCKIAESLANKVEEKVPRRQTRLYTRGDSTNSYLSDTGRMAQGEGSAPASISETSAAEPRLVKRQSIAKLIGARPAPMVRRSSFPALPQNPEVQALMLGHRQQSVDSDDEDGRGRRVRIIRRY